MKLGSGARWIGKTAYFCCMRMTISGLPRDFDKFDLQRLFNPFGWVDYTKIIIDPITGLSRGKGIVEMRDDQAKQAMGALQGKMLGTSPLNIKEAKMPPPRTDGGPERPGGDRGPGGDRRPGGDRGGYDRGSGSDRGAGYDRGPSDRGPSDRGY